MGNPFGRGRRARLGELEGQLAGIIARLDALETTPTQDFSDANLKAALDAIKGGLERRFGPVESRLDGVESALGDGERRVKALTFAVEEGIERVSRTERRIHATIKRARKELAERGLEDPGVEGEAAELRLVDGGRSEGGEVPEVQEGMGPAESEASSIPGVPAETLRRVRGF